MQGMFDRNNARYVDMFDRDVSFSLISAVRDGNLEEVKVLIHSFGLSYSAVWSQGYVLLYEAVKKNHSEVAKLLLTSGSKVNSKNKNAIDTPLHFAAINGDIEIVKMILDKGATINANNYMGKTPLYHAIENKKIEVAELLIRHGADVNARDSYGASLLVLAVEKGCLQIVEYLLNCGANINYVCTSAWKKRYVPLHFAVEESNKEVIRLLLSRGAEVDVKAEDSITPLHIAAKKGCIHTAEDLLNHGSSTHSVTLEQGYTPLHFASEVGNEEVVELLLDKGADVNAVTNDNLTPLLIATSRGHKTVVRRLLEHGSNVDNQDKYDKTTLNIAVQEGYLAIVEDVLKYCPAINQSNRSSLRIAVEGYKADHKKIIEVLLEYGLTVNPEDASNPKLLHNAVEEGYLKIIEDLLKYGADVNSSYTEGFTPLHTAAKNKQEEVAKLLISYEGDINAQDKSGKTPIFYAIANADLKITNLFLTNGANIKESPDLLNTAVRVECIEIVEALLQYGAGINGSDKYGATALHFTALKYFSKECDEIVDASYYGDIDITDSSTYGRTTVDFNYSIVHRNRFTKRHADINEKIANLLLSKGANVDAETIRGATTLHAAIQSEQTKLVGTLLKYNANVNSGVNKNYITPLYLSAQRGNIKICTMLLDKGANVNAKLKNGYTALHGACQKGHKEVVKVLLKCGVEVDSKSGTTSPLHLAARKGYHEIVETLLKSGANVDSRDESDRTALYIASEKEHANVVVTLLEYGSDINIKTKRNRTPLDHGMAKTSCFKNYCYRSTSQRVSDSCYEALTRHVVKLKTAHLFVSDRNLVSAASLCVRFGICSFQDECEKEIASMKNEKINNYKISFYDILVKSTSSLAICMRNENIVHVLKSRDYNTTFPIYASMIKSHFRKAMERKDLLERGQNVFHLLFSNFPELPYDCAETIFSYLNNEDLKVVMDACKPQHQ